MRCLSPRIWATLANCEHVAAIIVGINHGQHLSLRQQWAEQAEEGSRGPPPSPRRNKSTQSVATRPSLLPPLLHISGKVICNLRVELSTVKQQHHVPTTRVQRLIYECFSFFVSLLGRSSWNAPSGRLSCGCKRMNTKNINSDPTKTSINLILTRCECYFQFQIDRHWLT